MGYALLRLDGRKLSGRTKRRPLLMPPSIRLAEKQAARRERMRMLRRLRKAALEADAGRTISTRGLTDAEFLALLTR